MAAQAGPTIPFRAAAARHRISQVYTRPFVLGGIATIDLNRIGYLSELRININGTVTVAGTAAAASNPDATINYFPSIQIRSPQGDAPDSFSAKSLFDWNYRLFKVVSPASDPSFNNYNPTTLGAQPVNINYVLPLSLNDNLSFDTGMIMRNTPNNIFQLQLRFAASGDLQGTSTAIISATNLNVTVEEIYYDAVNPAVVIAPDFSTVVRLRESVYQNLAIGNNYIPYIPGPVLLEAMHIVNCNGVGDNVDVSRFQLVLNRTTYMDDRTSADIRAENYRVYAKAFRAGIHFFDYFDDSGEANVTRARDFINTQDASQVEFILNLAATANTANSNVTTMYRELVTLAA